MNPAIYTNYDVFVCCNSCFFYNKDRQKNFFLGNLRQESFNDIYAKLINNPIYNILANKGPVKLYKLFEKELTTIGFKTRDSYPKLGTCEFCSDLLSKKKYIDIYNSKLKLV
jgi:hypothetical protein